jgi:hypothetical protein
MRLIGRHDVVLLGGLGVALFVVFSPALERLINYVRAVDEARGLRLLPGLLILASVFVFQQLRKRQEIRTEAVGSAAVARMATERAAEMERLVTFGQALGRSLDEGSIRSTASAHIPLLAPGRRAWVMGAATTSGFHSPCRAMPPSRTSSRPLESRSARRIRLARSGPRSHFR